LDGHEKWFGQQKVLALCMQLAVTVELVLVVFGVSIRLFFLFLKGIG